MLTSFLLLFSAAAADLEPVRWEELALTIRRDPGISSDTVTLCRVRIENNGRGTWPGRRLAFEARALSSSGVAERQRGRFGLVLGPHEALETVIAFTGVYDRFEVSPAGKGAEERGRERARRGKPRSRGRKR